MGPLRATAEIAGSAWELVRLGVITRFRFRGPYWQWRLHTAFGRGYPPRRELIASIIEYARWMRQMRR